MRLALGLGVSLYRPGVGGGAPAPTPTPTPSFPAESRPATFSITNAGNAFGDSTTFGVGAPTGQDIVSRMRSGVTSGPTSQAFHLLGTTSLITANYFGNGGQSGQTTTTIAPATTYCKTNYPTEMDRIQFFSGGLNDYNITVGGWARDWPTQVKTNFATMATAANTAADYFFDLAPLESSNPPGTWYAADHAYHRRDMRATYGRRAVDQARWLRFRRQRENPTPGNADDIALTRGVIPYSYRGYPTANGDFADGDPAITTQAGAPTIGGAGTDGAIIWDSTGNTMYRCGTTGGWRSLDVKHQGRVGNTTLALMRRDMQAASEGSGPPFVIPDEMRCPADAANGAVVGQLLYTGTATSFAIADYAGTISTQFAVNATGQVTRLGTAPLTEGLTALMVAATNANGTLYSPLDMFITRPSTVTAPQMRTIATGLTIGARTACGMANGAAAISFALWLNPSAWSTTLFSTNKGNNEPLVLSLLANGKLRMTTKNNVSPPNGGTQAIINGNAVLALGAARWVFGKITMSAAQLYINDTADSLTGTFQGTGAFDFVTNEGGTASPTPSVSRPFFLASGAPNQLLEPASPFIGQIGFIGVWDADIDWSVQANRRQLMNADGSPLAGRTPFSAVGGAVPKIEMWGGLGDWLYGTPDGSNGNQTLSLDYRALTRMT